MTLSITAGGFSLDGEPFRVLSGAAHYFRSQPEQWPVIMQSLRAMGLNTVETYLAWNSHEPEEGVWRNLDRIDRFLDAAGEAGLRTIVRPGPYICAEWDNGGFPSWLTGRVGRALRTSDESFFAPVRRYLDRVVPRFAAHPSLLMVQIENEYGSYGADAEYLDALAAALVDRGVDAPLFTSDGPSDVALTGGSRPQHLATVNFGSNAGAAFDTLHTVRPDSPPFCMEFWCGWFDHWDAPRITRDPEDAAASLREILDRGASVNLYMAHGGTNFGTWAGANHVPAPGGGERLQPTVTSYDYDAPLDERGAPTEKFFAFRREFAALAAGDGARHPGAARELPELPELPPLVERAEVAMTSRAPLEFTLDAGSWAYPPSFEQLGLDHGLVRYRTTIPGPRAPRPLTLEGLRDRAHVYIDGELRAIVDGDAPVVDEVAGPAELEIVVESMGRVNYGPRLGETKGLDAVRHREQQLNGFVVDALPLPELPAIDWGAHAGSASTSPARPGPAFHRGAFELAIAGDGHLDLSGWSKGYAWVNGFCLGRYWERGPQLSLYVPWTVLREGANEVVLLDLDGAGAASAPGAVRLTPSPVLAPAPTSEAGR